MYARVRRIFMACTATFLLDFATAPAAAQSSADVQHQDPPGAHSGAEQLQLQHDMQHMHMEGDRDVAMPRARDGSGSSWLPDETPMYAVHARAGGWLLM